MEREWDREREKGKNRIYTERIFWNKIHIPNWFGEWNGVLGTIIRRRIYLKCCARIGCYLLFIQNIELNLRTFTSITKSPVEDDFLLYMFWFETRITLIRLSNKMHNMILHDRLQFNFCTFMDWPIAHCPLPITFYLLHVQFNYCNWMSHIFTMFSFSTN